MYSRQWQVGKKRVKPLTQFEKDVKKLDALFSLYIRLSNADDKGFCSCISCGQRYYYRNKGKKRDIAAGHFIPKSNSTYRTRWDERNVKPQCLRCNSFLEGNKYSFGLGLVEIYGPGICEELQLKSTKPFNAVIFDMAAKIKHYKEQNKILESKFKKQMSLI